MFVCLLDFWGVLFTRSQKKKAPILHGNPTEAAIFCFTPKGPRARSNSVHPLPPALPQQHLWPCHPWRPLPMAPSTEGRGGNDMRIKASSMEFRKMPQAPIFVESCSSSFLLQITCGHSRSSSDNNNNSSDSARVSGKCLAKHRFYHCCPSVRPVFHPIITWWYASSIRSHSLWASIKWFRVSFPLYLSISLSFCKSRTEHDMTLP